MSLVKRLLGCCHVLVSEGRGRRQGTGKSCGLLEVELVQLKVSVSNKELGKEGRRVQVVIARLYGWGGGTAGEGLGDGKAVGNQATRRPGTESYLRVHLDEQSVIVNNKLGIS
jgi:hypothetical protein